MFCFQQFPFGHPLEIKSMFGLLVPTFISQSQVDSKSPSAKIFHQERVFLVKGIPCMWFMPGKNQPKVVIDHQDLLLMELVLGFFINT